MTPATPQPFDSEADDLRIARETIAQAWCTKENAHKAMDSDLAEAGAKLFAGWIGTARQHLRNEEYYRGLLDECAKHLGEAVHIQDDGGRSESVLRAKIPELVAALAAPVESVPAPVGLEALAAFADPSMWEYVEGTISGPDCPDGHQDARIWLGADDPIELARASLSPRPATDTLPSAATTPHVNRGRGAIPGAGEARPATGADQGGAK